jgi:hypothetical protein
VAIAKPLNNSQKKSGLSCGLQRGSPWRSSCVWHLSYHTCSCMRNLSTWTQSMRGLKECYHKHRRAKSM